MKKIDIEDDLYKYILTNIEAFGETPSQILRRLLALPALIDDHEVNEQPLAENVIQTSDAKEQVDTVVNNSKSAPLDDFAPLENSVSALFDDPAFKKEPIVTNKFKMLLTTMYHEKRAAFIAAANTMKGRTRNYFGQNLSLLLESDNQQEVALLKASKPHNIPGTPFWVITNANTGRKRIILTQMMTAMGYPENLVKRIENEI